ncbi:uncharacterized protein LOC116590285 isoform X3 [Mustela erminea]|uniref:uncharacterized protein LOC116590285 isoform X3 n=1 Tax=Mustela erminea TaxID=36723 RepID=UPI00138725F0|nr:uncharacterized protein LOC116590285 isoform X3 [Mustela erminea]
MLRVQPRKPGPPPPRPAPSDPPRLKKVFLWPGRLLSAGVDPNATPQKRLPSATRFLTSPDSAHRVCGLRSISRLGRSLRKSQGPFEQSVLP